MSCVFAPANFFTLTSTDCSRGPVYTTVMDMNEYVLEILVQERLAEIRAAVEQSNRARAARADPWPRRFAWSQPLIRLRHCLRSIRRYSRVTIEARAAVEPRRASTPGAARG